MFRCGSRCSVVDWASANEFGVRRGEPDGDGDDMTVAKMGRHGKGQGSELDISAGGEPTRWT